MGIAFFERACGQPTHLLRSGMGRTGCPYMAGWQPIYEMGPYVGVAISRIVILICAYRSSPSSMFHAANYVVAEAQLFVLHMEAVRVLRRLLPVQYVANHSPDMMLEGAHIAGDIYERRFLEGAFLYEPALQGDHIHGLLSRIVLLFCLYNMQTAQIVYAQKNIPPPTPGGVVQYLLGHLHAGTDAALYPYS